MEQPRVFPPRLVAPDIHVVTAELPVPGLGVLAANAFVIHARRPVLVDAGVVALESAFLEQLSKVIAPEAIEYVWLTHTDPDHVGCLARVLDLSPRATLVTNFLGMGKLGLRAPVDPGRVHLVNPGQHVDAGDRALLAVSLPTYDAPETMGVFDEGSATLFSSDCFGAVLPRLEASARDLDRDALRGGMSLWTQVDAPWISGVDDAIFAATLARLGALSPRTVLSSHLPPAHEMYDELAAHLSAARRAPPFVGPDQAAMLAAALSA